MVKQNVTTISYKEVLSYKIVCGPSTKDTRFTHDRPIRIVRHNWRQDFCRIAKTRCMFSMFPLYGAHCTTGAFEELYTHRTILFGTMVTLLCYLNRKWDCNVEPWFFKGVTTILSRLGHVLDLALKSRSCRKRELLRRQVCFPSIRPPCVTTNTSHCLIYSPVHKGYHLSCCTLYSPVGNSI